MEPYIREATADTPKILLDSKNNKFEISKMSLPEDAIEFYTPILNWLEKYKEQPNTETTFDFMLEYFNTASSKQVIQMLLLLQEIAKKSKVTVRWFYKAIDEDMQSIGEEYSQIINVTFELVEY